MAAKGYTTEVKVEQYGLIDIDASYATQVDEWIESVENIIDDITGRTFIADEEASTRLFDGNGSRKLLIDDAAAVTLVEIGNDSYGGAFQTIPATGANRYFLEPTNGKNNSGKPVPYTSIVLNANHFVTGRQNQRITAKWGYSVEVPREIEFVATVFVFGIVNQQRQGGNSVKSERIGNYQVTYNSENGRDSWGDFERAMEILDTFKRHYL